MGSDSDLPVMQETAKILTELGVVSEVHTLSAHRTPEAVVDYVKESERNGYKVFVCGAGGAAHLAGVVAAHTALPVIGVPLTSSKMGSAGVDSLFSTVQMPPGIPVATVGINGAKNAGILAAQIIATGAEHSGILENIRMYKAKMAKEIVGKDLELQEKGFKKYLEDKGLV